MPFRSLFHPEWETYTDEGSQWDLLAHRAIKPIVDKAIEEGVSLKDLAYVLQGEVTSAICCGTMERNMKMKKEQQNGV